MSFSAPGVPRSARSTPAAHISPFSAPEDTILEPGAIPPEQLEPPRTRGSDSDVPIPNKTSESHDRPHSRSASRAGITGGAVPTVGPKVAGRRYSFDADVGGMHSGASMRAQRPRYRDDWDIDLDMRDYPTMRDYDRYWRGTYGPERYTSRRSARPPPAIFNGRRPMMGGHESDEEMYHDEIRFGKDPYYEPRWRRVDEEMGYHGGSPIHRETSSLQQQSFGVGLPRLNWNNLSNKEKAEVLRLPLTEWMNSEVKNHFVASLGEFVGTTMFLFFAFAGTEVANIGSAASDKTNTTTGESTGFNVATLLYISLSFGFSLMVNVWVFFRISGGLFNPAVTVGMVMVQAISIVRAMCLFVAQMAGAIAASAIVRYLFPESFNVRTTLGGGASLVQGVFIEAILTAELVFTIFMLAKEKHRATFIAPVGIGLALFISELVGVQFTGGSLNPARSFGPCVITGTFDSEHWIYWVGPFVGSIIAVLFYRFIKTLEYEMANPGADGDDANDPTKNPEKRAELQTTSKEAAGR